MRKKHARQKDTFLRILKSQCDRSNSGVGLVSGGKEKKDIFRGVTIFGCGWPNIVINAG